MTLRFNPSFYDTRKEVFFFSVLLFGKEKVVPTVVTFPRAYRTSAICRRLLLFGTRKKKGNANNWPLTAAAWCFWHGKWWWRWSFVMTAQWSLSLSRSLYITVHFPAAISTLIVKSYIVAGRGDTLLSLLCSSRLDGRDSPTGRQESQQNFEAKGRRKKIKNKRDQIRWGSKFCGFWTYKNSNNVSYSPTLARTLCSIFP